LVDVSLSESDWVLRALKVSPFSVPGPDCVLEALVAILLVNVSLSVLDLHVASLAAFPSVEVLDWVLVALGVADFSLSLPDPD
jgi:hypothetical protein